MRWLCLIVLAGCGKPTYVEPRLPCAQHDANRSVFFGDLHVHTTYSFDVNAFEVRNTPVDAYRFARGATLTLPPLDADGNGTRSVKLERPLDFAAVTDHSEFLGEVEACTTPGANGYDSPTCTTFRAGSNQAIVSFAFNLTNQDPVRSEDLCGRDGKGCSSNAGAVWARIQSAAENAYDKTAACSFTSFVAYEYTAATNYSTLHRNVIFANDHVPAPTTYFEQPSPQGLWKQLKATCLDGAIPGCDVLAIPHNPNESNGHMFVVEYPGASGVDEQKAQAQQRSEMEPLVEIYQHKAASECMNGIGATLGAPDEQCSFEAPRRNPVTDCGDSTGVGGVTRLGCFSSLDFVRGALLAGLAENERLGVNPYRLGIIASTDTHNGTPGLTDERDFVGHRGTDDDTAAKRLGNGSLTPGGIEFSGGGLTAVWAEENSRPSLFAALRRREVYGTSGPRLTVRFFGAPSLPADLCSDPNLVSKAYAAGVPMGSVLPKLGTAPSFVVAALRDPGTPSHPSVPLQRIQIVKGWRDAAGNHQAVYDIGGNPNNGASVDADCTPHGAGDDSLCAVFTDPDFHATDNAFYYARVLENPTCRWSTYECNALALADRPASCTDPTIPKTVQERAWTSPIWYSP